MDTVGPISRTVEDAAITFGAIAGHDPKDPYTWDLPVPDYRNALTGDISSIKVGIIRDRLEDSLVERESREAVSTAISDLGELGASLEDVAIPLAKDAGAITMSLIGVEWSALHRNAFLGDFKAFDHNNRIRFLSGSLVPSQMYYKAQKLRSMLREQVLSALEQVDVLVLPTGPFAALPVESVPGVRSKEQAMADFNRPHQLHRPVQPGRCARSFGPLQVQFSQPAPGVADSRPPLRRRNGAKSRPRLRAGPPVVHPKAAHLDEKSQQTCFRGCVQNSLSRRERARVRGIPQGFRHVKLGLFRKHSPHPHPFGRLRTGLSFSPREKELLTHPLRPAGPRKA